MFATEIYGQLCGIFLEKSINTHLLQPFREMTEFTLQQEQLQNLFGMASSTIRTEWFQTDWNCSCYILKRFLSSKKFFVCAVWTGVMHMHIVLRCEFVGKGAALMKKVYKTKSLYSMFLYILFTICQNLTWRLLRVHVYCHTSNHGRSHQFWSSPVDLKVH